MYRYNTRVYLLTSSSFLFLSLSVYVIFLFFRYFCFVKKYSSVSIYLFGMYIREYNNIIYNTLIEREKYTEKKPGGGGKKPTKANYGARVYNIRVLSTCGIEQATPLPTNERSATGALLIFSVVALARAHSYRRRLRPRLLVNGTGKPSSDESKIIIIKKNHNNNDKNKNTGDSFIRSRLVFRIYTRV